MDEQIKNGKILHDNEYCRFVLVDDEKALLLDWKHVTNLTLADFKNCVAEFASYCKKYRPGRAVIDARALDPDGDVLGWVSGQKKIDGEEEYKSWWIRELIPLYNEAGISSLSVATGNPNAPGKVAYPPETFHFKVGYLNDLDAAMLWGKN